MDCLVGYDYHTYKEPKLMSEDEKKREKRRLIKNILLISIGFLMTFNAYQGLARLQTSLHKDEGMGTITQSTLYATLMLSCFFLPTLIINIIGHKWTIPVSFCGYILWMAANGYAVWGTMVTASIIVGLAAAPLWTAQCSYFTLVAKWYASLSGETTEAVTSRFFGIFFFFFQLSSITGSIISSTTLNTGHNGTIDYDTAEYCGANDCPDDNVTDIELNDPSDNTVWTMVGVFIAIAVCAVFLVSFFVDQVPKHLLPEEVDIKSEIVNLILNTFKHLRHRNQLFIIPLTIYSGFEQAYYNAEFTQSFVTCSIGIWNVGFVTLPFGVVNAIVSFSGGYVVKLVGRLPVFTAGLIMDLCIQFTLMFWPPDPDRQYVLYILAGMWGFSDGIWQTQINALYGTIFSKESEAAFSNYRMWESLGFIIAFAYSAFLCTGVKTYILTCVLVIGMIGYYIVEYNVPKNSTIEGVESVERNIDGNQNGGYTLSHTDLSEKSKQMSQGEVAIGDGMTNGTYDLKSTL